MLQRAFLFLVGMASGRGRCLVAGESGRRKLDDWGVPSYRSDVWSGAASDKAQSPVSRVRYSAQRAARDAWLAHVMLTLLFLSHLEGIGGVEATAVFARGEHHAPLIHQIHQMGKGFSQRIEFLVDGPFVPVGVLPRGIACDINQAGMAVDHQLVQFFQSVSVEAFQKIDALGYSREGDGRDRAE